MTAVSQKTLNWLYSVLTSEYHDVNRTYNDVAQALSLHPSLSPRTDVYTYETGASALLLCLSGTLPVSFRGTLYHFPVSLWIPYAYPREAPFVYVTPTQGMLVRPGQHVSGEGRVYHPYLAGWTTFWDKSKIVDLLFVLRDVFTKEPPVVAQQRPESARSSYSGSAPPPVPPLPPELDKTSAPQQLSPRTGPSSAMPPLLPPKPEDRHASRLPLQMYTSVSANEHAPPPRPPLPGSSTVQHASNEHWSPNVPFSQASYPPHDAPPGPSNAQSVIGGRVWPQRLSSPPEILYVQSMERDSPVSPISPENSTSAHFPPYRQPLHQYQYDHQVPPIQSFSPLTRKYPQHYTPNERYASADYPLRPPQTTITSQNVSRTPPTIQQTEDLLSSPLSLPSQSAANTQSPGNSRTGLPAPPIPPNPEKDALLRAIGTSLYQERQRTRAQARSNLGSLRAQHAAMVQSASKIQQELDNLHSLDASLTSNERILADSIRRTDEVMDDAKTREVPSVEELLVAPTIVGQQLYRVVAEERALEDVMFILARALDRGRIGLDVFLKQTRSLAREQFLKMALVKKIGRGMGLSMQDDGSGSGR